MLCSEESRRFLCSDCPAAHISLCSHLSDEEIEEFRALATGVCYRAGSAIFQQGEELNSFLIIVSGIARLSRLLANGKRQIIGFLGPGDLMGSIKRGAEAYCTAEAISQLDACYFDRARFGHFLQDHPDLCLKLLIVATDEIEAQYDHAVLLGRMPASERMAIFLLSLATRWRTKEDEPNVIHIPMPRSDIADHLGLTIETVSRVLTRFKNLGFIEFRRPKIAVLKNLAALDDLAGVEQLPKSRMSIGL